MSDFKAYVVKCEIHVEVEMTASTQARAQKTVTSALTKILTEHRLEVNEVSYHNLSVTLKESA